MQEPQLEQPPFAIVTSRRCPVMQKDLELIKHVLTAEKDGNEAPFTPYLTKNQRKKLNRATYQTRFKGELSDIPK